MTPSHGKEPLRHFIFLPGAGGSPEIWRPLAREIGDLGKPTFLSWPGLGNEPADPRVNDMDDLVRLVEASLGAAPADVFAQSMGGVVALKLALRNPERVRSLVLAVTSGGIPMADFGAADWRPDYRQTYPQAASWIMESQEDLSDSLHAIAVPVLLLFGDADAISPVAAGKRLRERLPRAELKVVEGGAHDLVSSHARIVSPIVRQFLDRV